MLKKLKLGLVALLLPLVAFAQSYPSPTFNNLTVQGTFTLSGGLPPASLAAQAANTVLANVTASSASPTAVALPSCSSANSALKYTNATGFSCGTTYALTSGTLAQFAATTSAQLLGIISDETGTGSLVFGTGATIGTATINTPTISGGTINNATVGQSTPLAGSFTTLSSTGNFTPSQTNGIVGTTTTNNANAGSVGEYVSSTVAVGSAVAMTTATPVNITTISLTAGDWDVWGETNFTATGTTTVSFVLGSINTVSATNNAQMYSLQPGINGSVVTIQGMAVPMQRISVASTTTIYLVAQATFATSTLSAYGSIGARRRR